MAEITRNDIEDGLRQLGLGAGDIVLLHSSLASLGHVEGGADTVIDAFLGVLGESGTLVVPTFGALGAIPDAVKARAEVVHSIHPLASAAAIGPAAEDLCRDHWQPAMAHAEDTPYTRIANQGGYVCLLGVDQDRNTTLHTVEELLRLPYMKTTSEKTFETPAGKVSKSWDFFPGPHRDFIGIDRLLHDSGKMRRELIGSAVVRLIKSRDLIDVCLEAARRDPAWALCDNPNCADCVSQRGALRCARFAKEDFTVVAAAALAGRYVPEMIDQCLAAGIGHLELDCLRGQPLAMHRRQDIVKAVGELREGGIEVVALRLATLAATPAKALPGLARETGVPRLVLPLSPAASAFAVEAEAKGLAAVFANTAHDSFAASDMLLRLRADGATPRLSFSAANFARCGEHPFLYSYKQKLRRFIEELEVEDVCYDGTPQPLAHGNAEVREMISILRCASFNGYLLLGAGNRHCSTLPEAAQRLAELLDSM